MGDYDVWQEPELQALCTRQTRELSEITARHGKQRVVLALHLKRQHEAQRVVERRLASRFDKCDECDRTAPDVTILECVTRRPSDPTSLCCVMTTCSHCMGDVEPEQPIPGDVVPSVGTSGQISEWVEAHGAKHGIAFHE